MHTLIVITLSTTASYKYNAYFVYKYMLIAQCMYSYTIFSVIMISNVIYQFISL